MKEKILVVDDDPDILKVVSAFLELEGFEVKTVQSLKEAKELFFGFEPSLIILDIMLPDENGLSWLKELKTHYPILPVLLLTAKGSVSDKVLGFEMGADDYLAKPFEPLELVARCKALIRKRELFTNLKARGLKVGNLLIDLSAKRVFKNDKEVKLTPTEWKILSLLVSKIDEVVSREELRKEIWQKKKIYDWSRVLDVHIKHLREKLEDDPSDPKHIVTVHGFGYMFKGS